MSEIKTTKLDNGIRIITDSMPDVDTLSIGIWTAAGSRDENPTYSGAAHMVEHMLFKGTPNRDALQIAQEIENVGGHMNAYTGREITSYHAQVLKEDMPLAMEVIADMYCNSIMPEEEVERERHVILQEIGMVYDTPDDLVFDRFYETGFSGQRLGLPILGRPETIENMQREPLMEHVQDLYTPARTVISAAGNVDHDNLVEKAQAVMKDLPVGKLPEKETANYTGGDYRDNRDLEQAHMVLGFQGIPLSDKDYYNAQMISNILGGSMSSRLFQEVREKRGLAYSIYSFHSGYTDTGIMGIYAGTGPQDVGELIPVITYEIINLADTLEDEEVERARSQMKASLMMGRESTMTRANQQAKYLALRNKTLDLEWIVNRIDRITREDLQKTACRIFSSPLTLTALGPLDRLEPHEKITGRLAA